MYICALSICLYNVKFFYCTQIQFSRIRNDLLFNFKLNFFANNVSNTFLPVIIINTTQCIQYFRTIIRDSTLIHISTPSNLKTSALEYHNFKYSCIPFPSNPSPPQILRSQFFHEWFHIDLPRASHRDPPPRNQTRETIQKKNPSTSNVDKVHIYTYIYIHIKQQRYRSTSVSRL